MYLPHGQRLASTPCRRKSGYYRRSQLGVSLLASSFPFLRRFCEAGLGKSMEAKEVHTTWLALFQVECPPIAIGSFLLLHHYRKRDAVRSSEAADPSHWYPIVVRISEAARREYRIPILRCLALNKISGLFPGRGHDLQSDSGSLDQSYGECLSNGRFHLPPLPPPIADVASLPAMRYVDIATMAPRCRAARCPVLMLRRPTQLLFPRLGSRSNTLPPGSSIVTLI